jgi:cytochrome c
VEPRSNATDSQPIAGKLLFEQECARCHAAINASADTSAHSTGPNLYGIVGRRVATASNYEYSAALRTSSFVWSEENLVKYINDPQAAIPCRPLRIRAIAMCPGIHMSFQGLHNIHATKAVVDYLRTIGKATGTGSQQQLTPIKQQHIHVPMD